MTSYTPLPARSGRIAYRRREGELWGEETWSLTRDRAGNRCLTAHCEMAFGNDDVVRDSILAVDAGFQPLEAYVRILNHGVPTGSGWFRFADREAEGESFSTDAGRLSQRMAITRPMRGFGIHALMGDGWLSATFPFDKGEGTEHFFGRNLIHSLHHFGATGPKLEVSTSGLRYETRETVTVRAGTFDCYRVAFVGMTNAHPPYVMWISADGDFLYVRGVVEGYMDSVFELEEVRG
jgi:hypothetical protein